jgi:hypothetical protein
MIDKLFGWRGGKAGETGLAVADRGSEALPDAVLLRPLGYEGPIVAEAMAGTQAGGLLQQAAVAEHLKPWLADLSSHRVRRSSKSEVGSSERRLKPEAKAAAGESCP